MATHYLESMAYRRGFWMTMCSLAFCGYMTVAWATLGYLAPAGAFALLSLMLTGVATTYWRKWHARSGVSVRIQ